MREHERQVAPNRDGIRRDHVARYEWAVRELGNEPRTVLDLCCGVGYGTQLLAQAGHEVVGIDVEHEALAYAREHYAHARATYKMLRAEQIGTLGRRFDAVVAFECIEHIADPLPMLRELRGMADRLIASVPNENVFPWNKTKFHFRHYTPEQFEELLADAGWHVDEWMMQAGAHSDVEEGVDGRTVIAVCSAKREPRAVMPHTLGRKAPDAVPESVSILGLGPSVAQYLEFAKRFGNRHKLSDEIWGINALGDVLRCDRVFHMDDVRVQQIRAKEAPESNIAAMLEWMRTYDGVIYTSIPHPDYPATVAYPLEDVINSCSGFVYFNSTAAYAVALAIHLGVKKINLFGVDFTYPNAHDAEKGRACVEWWLGFAAARGVKIATARTSSLLDAYTSQDERVYGYDCVHVRINEAGGKTSVAFVEREQFPTAAEIEARYDHSRHPNALVEQEQQRGE
jgi:hypothetical protein